MKRRKVFDLYTFVIDLYNRYMLDDLVYDYKSFLKHSSKDIKQKSYEYVINHDLIKNDKYLQSYVELCHKN